jgi:hypothetical protein
MMRMILMGPPYIIVNQGYPMVVFTVTHLSKRIGNNGCWTTMDRLMVLTKFPAPLSLI